MMIRSMTAFVCISAMIGCGKKDDDSSSSGPARGPALGLVGGENFKNTAKNGADVSSTMGKLETEMKGGNFALQGVPRSKAKNSSLFSFMMGQVQPSQLAGTSRSFRGIGEQESPGPSAPSFTNLQFGGSCDSQAAQIDKIYESLIAGMRMASEQLTKLDSKNLPEGVTRLEADDKFAVGYAIDLSKQNLKDSTQDLEQEVPQIGAEAQNAKVDGVMTLTAGANDNEVALSSTIKSNAKSEGGSAVIDGGITALGNVSAKTIRVKAIGSVSAQGSEQGSGNFKGDQDLEIVGGANPAVTLKATIEGSSSDGSETKSGKVVASFKIAKVAAEKLQLSYSIDNGQEVQQKDLMLVSSNGACKVQ
jgi:hypothetical protein